MVGEAGAGAREEEEIEVGGREAVARAEAEGLEYKDKSSRDEWVRSRSAISVTTRHGMAWHVMVLVRQGQQQADHHLGLQAVVETGLIPSSVVQIHRHEAAALLGAYPGMASRSEGARGNVPGA